MSKFDIAIVNRPVTDCAGIMVKTSMEKASVDCPALWESFGPRMCEVSANPEFPDQSFGASVMTSESGFDYWALMPLAPGAAVPEGMKTFTLPAGDYAECRLGSLKEMGDAYKYIYTEWPSSQEKYGLDMGGVSYEGYTSDYMKTGELVIYCPLKAK